jgi:hypothetical protein
MSAKEKQATRSGICFSCVINEQTPDEIGHEALKARVCEWCFIINLFLIRKSEKNKKGARDDHELTAFSDEWRAIVRDGHQYAIRTDCAIRDECGIRAKFAVRTERAIWNE